MFRHCSIYFLLSLVPGVAESEGAGDPRGRKPPPPLSEWWMGGKPHFYEGKQGKIIIKSQVQEPFLL